MAVTGAVHYIRSGPGNMCQKSQTWENGLYGKQFACYILSPGRAIYCNVARTGIYLPPYHVGVSQSPGNPRQTLCPRTARTSLTGGLSTWAFPKTRLPQINSTE